MKIEYYKYTNSEGGFEAGGRIWTGETRLAIVCEVDDTRFFAADNCPPLEIEEDLGSALLAGMVADQDDSLERELAAMGIVEEDLAYSAPGLVDARKSTEASQADKRVVDLEDE